MPADPAPEVAVAPVNQLSALIEKIRQAEIDLDEVAGRFLFLGAISEVGTRPLPHDSASRYGSAPRSQRIQDRGDRSREGDP
jgi:hypothetical protein